MPSPAEVIAALRGQSQDPMPFGVGGPAEPAVEAPALLGAVASGSGKLVKDLVEASTQSPMPGLRREDYTDIPGSAQPSDPLTNASAEMAMALMGSGAPAAEAGAAGIFGGKLAKGADLNKLAKAQFLKNYEMRDPEFIRQETGWWQSPADQQWRFRIPDVGTRVLGHGLNYGKEGTWLSGPAHAFVQHPELFEHYPQLGKSPFQNAVLQKPKNEVGRGQYSSTSKAMSVEAPDLPRARSVALHELQHGVQDIEGFAPGSTPEFMADLLRYRPRKIPPFERGSHPRDLYWRQAGEVEARATQADMDLSRGSLARLPFDAGMDTPFHQQLLYNPRNDMVTALRHLKYGPK